MILNMCNFLLCHSQLYFTNLTTTMGTAGWCLQCWLAEYQYYKYYYVLWGISHYKLYQLPRSNNNGGNIVNIGYMIKVRI